MDENNKLQKLEVSKDNKYMPTLDGIRGFACILVVFSHIEYNLIKNNIDFGLGSLGVIIFFSLSGFLMGKLYLGAELSKSNVFNYSISRISRILPAYYLAIIFSVLLFQFYPDLPFQMTLIMTLRSFAFLGSAGVFWSIPPEIQFYGFFVFIWAAFYILKTRRNYIPLIVVTLTIIGCFLTRNEWPGILLPNLMHVFVLGVLVAYLSNIPALTKIVYHVFFQIMITIIFAIYLFYGVENSLKDVPLAVIISLAILSLSSTSWFTKIFAHKVMRLIGAASFSIYLLHYQLIYVVKEEWLGDITTIWETLFLLTISLLFPILFYKFAEKPLHSKVKNALLKLNFYRGGGIYSGK